MNRILLAAVLVVGLAGCTTTTPPSPEAVVTESCLAYGHSLSVLAAARYQGRLTPAQIATVNQANSVVVPLCTTPTPPTGAATVIDSVNQTLENLIFQVNQGPVS